MYTYNTHTLGHTHEHTTHTDTYFYAQHTLRQTCSHIIHILVHILRPILVHTPTQPQWAKITYPETKRKASLSAWWSLALLGKNEKYSVKSWMPALGKRMWCHNQGVSFSSIEECKSPSSCPVCLLSYNKSDILDEIVSLSFPNTAMTCLLKKDLGILKCRDLFKIYFKINYYLFICCEGETETERDRKRQRMCVRVAVDSRRKGHVPRFTGDCELPHVDLGNWTLEEQ